MFKVTELTLMLTRDRVLDGQRLPLGSAHLSGQLPNMCTCCCSQVASGLDKDGL